MFGLAESLGRGIRTLGLIMHMMGCPPVTITDVDIGSDIDAPATEPTELESV
jgi:hypothetical protein